jgi:hypothetical protein
MAAGYARFANAAQTGVIAGLFVSFVTAVILLHNSFGLFELSSNRPQTPQAPHRDKSILFTQPE